MTISRIVLFSFALLLSFCLCSAVQVSYDERALTIDGERRIILSGSIHYPRSTPEMWPDLVQKSKDGGLNAIETYVFWNVHEPLYRQYNFEGNLDLVRFIKTIQSQGLYAILRIGPYVCAEWNYGGLPVWLHNIPDVKFRTNNKVFEDEMKTFVTMIVEMMKHENLFASQGGPIILAQIENEYGNIMWKFGSDGVDYMDWCAQLALSYDTGVPWIMCQQDNAPAPMISTCNGYYCDQYYPKRKGIPKMWTENWTGWFKNWGSQDPHRTARDVAFAVARFFQFGGTLQNYYMYHGGTNFGRTSGGPYITTSYDYDAPLDEYGNLNQPKWGHLQKLHFVLRSMEKVLTNGFQRTVDYGNMVSVTTYNYEGKEVCFLGNANQSSDATINFQNTMFTIPAWSVSILPDCYNEVYNTAKVNSQQSIMIKSPNEADDGEEPYQLQWNWRSEHFAHRKKDGTVDGSSLIANALLEQKSVTNDTSDYLWYITSVNISQNDPILTTEQITIQVSTSGHVLHAFINGKHIGTQFAQNGQYSFTFERKLNLTIGVNDIVLLSATVGLANYGPEYEDIPVGITGSVQLVGTKSNQKVIIDLSKNQWIYKVGLAGYEKQLYAQTPKSASYVWHDIGLPTSRMFVWYKSTFPAPLGTDPVVVDLMGLGKGEAWVNGQSLGRYWPKFEANEDGCSYSCDYRGAYGSNKCLTNCGKPTQRWYHIPRSFLKADNNEIVLFEEFGGNPWNVQFQTVTIGTACADAYEGNTLELSCQGGRVISDVKFVSFGLPQGSCGSFSVGRCESPKAYAYVMNICLGKVRCSIPVNELTLGPTGCKETNRLAIEAVC
ncbi:beta-galactosidase 7 [Ziziphus jujuba]|uniref:Beta-galactosidase n=1 Tax=Ziziphus jujuba TaxID=326968 RepID=A0ABM3I603_ZIZJJ|nr:beta-galactosidase 7 [Ziziphus jujuba]